MRQTQAAPDPLAAHTQRFDAARQQSLARTQRMTEIDRAREAEGKQAFRQTMRERLVATLQDNKTKTKGVQKAHTLSKQKLMKSRLVDLQLEITERRRKEAARRPPEDVSSEIARFEQRKAGLQPKEATETLDELKMRVQRRLRAGEQQREKQRRVDLKVRAALAKAESSANASRSTHRRTPSVRSATSRAESVSVAPETRDASEAPSEAATPEPAASERLIPPEVLRERRLMRQEDPRVTGPLLEHREVLARRREKSLRRKTRFCNELTYELLDLSSEVAAIRETRSVGSKLAHLEPQQGTHPAATLPGLSASEWRSLKRSFLSGEIAEFLFGENPSESSDEPRAERPEALQLSPLEERVLESIHPRLEAGYKANHLVAEARRLARRLFGRVAPPSFDAKTTAADTARSSRSASPTRSETSERKQLTARSRGRRSALADRPGRSSRRSTAPDPEQVEDVPLAFPQGFELEGVTLPARRPAGDGPLYVAVVGPGCVTLATLLGSELELPVVDWSLPVDGAPAEAAETVRAALLAGQRPPAAPLAKVLACKAMEFRHTAQDVDGTETVATPVGPLREKFRGVILSDFPATADEAKAFEKEMGFDVLKGTAAAPKGGKTTAKGGQQPLLKEGSVFDLLLAVTGEPEGACFDPATGEVFSIGKPPCPLEATRVAGLEPLPPAPTLDPVIQLYSSVPQTPLAIVRAPPPAVSPAPVSSAEQKKRKGSERTPSRQTPTGGRNEVSDDEDAHAEFLAALKEKEAAWGLVQGRLTDIARPHLPIVALALPLLREIFPPPPPPVPRALLDQFELILSDAQALWQRACFWDGLLQHRVATIITDAMRSYTEQVRRALDTNLRSNAKMNTPLENQRRGVSMLDSTRTVSFSLESAEERFRSMIPTPEMSDFETPETRTLLITTLGALEAELLSLVPEGVLARGAEPVEPHAYPAAWGAHELALFAVAGIQITKIIAESTLRVAEHYLHQAAAGAGTEILFPFRELRLPNEIGAKDSLRALPSFHKCLNELYAAAPEFCADDMQRFGAQAERRVEEVKTFFLEAHARLDALRALSIRSTDKWKSLELIDRELDILHARREALAQPVVPQPHIEACVAPDKLIAFVRILARYELRGPKPPEAPPPPRSKPGSRSSAHASRPTSEASGAYIAPENLVGTFCMHGESFAKAMASENVTALLPPEFHASEEQWRAAVRYALGIARTVPIAPEKPQKKGGKGNAPEEAEFIYVHWGNVAASLLLPRRLTARELERFVTPCLSRTVSAEEFREMHDGPFQLPLPGIETAAQLLVTNLAVREALLAMFGAPGPALFAALGVGNTPRQLLNARGGLRALLPPLELPPFEERPKKPRKYEAAELLLQSLRAPERTGVAQRFLDELAAPVRGATLEEATRAVAAHDLLTLAHTDFAQAAPAHEEEAPTPKSRRARSRSGSRGRSASRNRR